MDLFDKLSFWFSPTSAVLELVGTWNVGGCGSEKQCEDSLYDYLQRSLDGVQIIRQYGRARSFVDIMVADRVMVELKYELTSTAEYQRLVGQLVGYKEWNKDIIVVLVGNTEPNLLKNLQKVVDKEFVGFTLFDNNVTIVEKRSG